jgi:hypothetical protein
MEQVLEPVRHPSPIYADHRCGAKVLVRRVKISVNAIPRAEHDDIRCTCKSTKIPPRNQATALAPFLTKTPAHTPATVPNPNSYSDTDDVGGGPRSSG